MSKRISDEDIGDVLDLEKEKTYPCSDGGITTTIDIDAVAEAQRISSDKEWIEALDKLGYGHVVKDIEKYLTNNIN